jgi:hypothetical protein
VSREDDILAIAKALLPRVAGWSEDEVWGEHVMSCNSDKYLRKATRAYALLEPRLMAYQAAHDEALRLGFPSLTEALEKLDR